MFAHVPNPAIIPPKFLWASNIVSMIFGNIIYSLFLKKLLSKNPRNCGGSMPGFGTWSKSIVFMVITFAVY